MTLRMRCDDPAERASGLTVAIGAVRRGELVVLPAETAYAVATAAFSSRGLERLRTAKGRGRDLPVPVMVGWPRTVDGLAHGLDETARALLEAFWPGPLTVVVRAQPSLAWDLGEAGGTVSLRMPLHPVALELLRETGPLAVTTANRAGLPAPATADDAEEQLGGDLAVVLDAGPCPPGPPSTVLDLTGEVPRVLREGALALAALREVVPGVLGSGEAEHAPA